MSYILLYSKYAKSEDKILKFLIDTGAAVSLIKSESLLETPVDKSKAINLNGLNPNSPIPTIGEINLELQIHKQKINSEFQVIGKNTTNIPFDGLIGHRFFKKQNCTIDYAKSVIKINSSEVPLCSNSPQFSKTYASVKGRSETIISINIKNPKNIREGIVHSQNIANESSLLLPNCIVSVNKENRALITVVNTSMNPKTFLIPEIELEPLSSQVNIFQLAAKDADHPNSVSENRCFRHLNKVNHSHNRANDAHSENRVKTLNQNLRLNHLNKEEKDSISEICKEFKDIFHLPSDVLTQTTCTSCKIPTTDEIPVHVKSYRFPNIHKCEVEKQINKMLEQGIIKPSTSPYSAPIWVVPKKSDASGKKKWRVVIDYRKLNEKTIGDAYPLPNIEDILDQLGHSIYFTTLDLANGFHQIPMDPDDGPKTAFSTPDGHYEYTRMPFGLRNAPACFQRSMNKTLMGLTNRQCFVYIDDVVIYGSSLEDHNRKLINVLSRLRENNLKLQPDKCEFLRKSVEYLGHVISEKGVCPNPNKIECIKQISKPSNQKQIKMFLGMVGYYRKFINNFSTIAKPLTQLLKKDKTFEWTQAQDKAFQCLKEILTSKPLLQYPDFSIPFVLTTDAFNVGVGAVLSQIKDNKDLPVAYYSRTLNKTEQNYSTTEKELLAIINSVEHFRPYLYGKLFTIYTDHRALVWLHNCQNPSSKLIRWRLRLSEYQYEIKYKAGRINSNADGLSRLITEESVNHNTIFNASSTYDKFIEFHYKNQENIIIDKINTHISKIRQPLVIVWSLDLNEENIYYDYINENFNIKDIDATLNSFTKITNDLQTIYLLFPTNMFFDKLEYKHLFNTLENFKKEIKTNDFILGIPDKHTNIKMPYLFEMLKFIYSENKVTLLNTNKIEPKDQAEINKILEENHDNKLTGHSGFNRTYNRIKEIYFWPSLKSDVRDYVRNCISCQRNKTNFNPTKQPMEITSTSDKPFQKLAIDIVGPLPLTEAGNRFILTAQDDLTKYSFAEPLPNHESLTIAKTLTKIFTTFGIPKSILSDQGSDFMSQLMKDLTNLFKTKHISTTPYHPQSNGALERSHLTLKDYLKHYIKVEQNDWDEYVQFAMFSYNTAVHKSTKHTPYELLFGRLAYLPSSITQDPKFHYTYDDYIKSLQNKLNHSFKVARDNLIESKVKSKTYHDSKTNSVTFKANDLVWLINKATKFNRSKKLSPNFKGPYKILEINSNKTAILEIGKKQVRYHTNMLKPFVADGKNHHFANPTSLNP